MKRQQQTIRMQRVLVYVSIVLFIVKVIAWQMTGSVAILTDALESIVNVIAGFIGLYSIILSSKPRDKEHPYGHGKIEFISSAIEGTLITIAGIIIIFKAIDHLRHPEVLKQLDYGLLLVAFSALVNYLVGQLCVSKGRKENSPILIASGTHLKSDTYSSLGLLLGLLLMFFTGYHWIDSIAALIFAFIIIYTGYKILRKSISGIMDESDTEILDQIVDVLNRHRLPEWIDVHNMRVIDYAGFYHIDCHLTVPYYYTINEGHAVLDSLTLLVREHFNDRVEFFIHVDGCLPSQCSLCAVTPCPVREHEFVKHLTWTQENVLFDGKHSLA